MEPVQPHTPVDAPRNPTVARNETVARLVFVVTMLLIFIMAARTPLDTDMWWHLSSGEETLRTGQVLLTDIFSFTRAGARWVNASWLADLGMAVMFRWQGYLALSAAVAILAVISMALVWFQCQGPLFLRAAAVLLGSVVCSVVWSPRPQVVSLVFMALVGYLLYLYKWRGADRLWILPLVFMIWGNVHGGYPLGIMLIAAMLAGETFNHLLAIPSQHILSWKKILRLAAFGVLSGFAVLINPNGLDMWQLPFQTVNMQVLQQFIPEWASPDFHQVLQQMLLMLLLAVFAAVALSGKTMDVTDLFLVLGFAVMALVARRNFGPFAIAAAPVLTRYGAAAFASWRERAGWIDRYLRSSAQNDPGESRRVLRVKKIINLLFVALLAFTALVKLVIVSHPALVSRYLVEGYPVRAAAWLNQNHPGGPMLNEYNWGGWMHRELRDFPVFVDGRTDLFGDEVIGAWITAVQAGPGWQDTLARYPVDLVMLQPDRPLLENLPSSSWEKRYQDDQVVIYGRK